MGEVSVTLTESAYSDLEEIEHYISPDSPLIARRFISKILDKIEHLKRYPQSGKPVLEYYDAELRELLLNKYRIIYRIRDDENVAVLRIIHGARLLDLEID